jgi:hypothetical protein
MDARKAEFNTLVATPLVSCIDKLHNFASAVAVAREEVRRVPGMHPSERIQKFSLMQRQEFASARSQLQIAIAAAAKYQQTSPRDWYGCEDGLDAVLDAFDTLCREDTPTDRLAAALERMLIAVTNTCDITRDMIARRLREFG